MRGAGKCSPLHLKAGANVVITKVGRQVHDVIQTRTQLQAKVTRCVNKNFRGQQACIFSTQVTIYVTVTHYDGTHDGSCSSWWPYS